jgi:hypothetical protein
MNLSSSARIAGFAKILVTVRLTMHWFSTHRRLALYSGHAWVAVKALYTSSQLLATSIVLIAD